MRPGDRHIAFFDSANHWDRVFRMKIRVGFEMIYDFPQPTPLIMVLGTHFTRASDIIVPDHLTTSPSVADHALSRRLRQLVQPDCRPPPAACVSRQTARCATAACPM